MISLLNDPITTIPAFAIRREINDHVDYLTLENKEYGWAVDINYPTVVIYYDIGDVISAVSKCQLAVFASPEIIIDYVFIELKAHIISKRLEP